MKQVEFPAHIKKTFENKSIVTEAPKQYKGEGKQVYEFENDKAHGYYNKKLVGLIDGKTFYLENKKLNPTLFAVDKNGELYGAVLPLNARKQENVARTIEDTLTDPTPSKLKSFSKKQTDGKASRETEIMENNRYERLRTFKNDLPKVWFAYSYDYFYVYANNSFSDYEVIKKIRLDDKNTQLIDAIERRLKDDVNSNAGTFDRWVKSFQSRKRSNNWNFGNASGGTSTNRIDGMDGQQRGSESQPNSQTSNGDSKLKGKASRELDTEYLNAVERGDTDTAQRMVDKNGELYGAVLPLNARKQENVARTIEDTLTDPTPSKLKSFSKKQTDGKASRETSKKKKSKVPPVDEFATNAMIWAYSTKTDIGEQKIFYRKNKWVLLEKTNDGFIELGQYNSNHYDFINEEVNKHNEELYNSGIDERIYNSIMRYENLGINDSWNYGNDVGQQTSNGRAGEIHQEQSESNGSRDNKGSKQNKGAYSRELDSLGNELTEEQAEFFKDSKVRDAEGNLLVVYHGTNVKRSFYTFRTNSSPAWFTPAPGYANAFAYGSEKKVVHKTYLNITNPLYLGNIDGIANDESLRRLSATSKIDIDTLKNILSEENSVNIFKITNSKKFKNLIKRQGYDGMVAREGGVTSYAVFEPNQIKSVDNAFPSDDNDIRYSREIDALDYITPEDEFEAVDEMAFSNRELLANALLDTVTTSEEYKLIRSYQEEIAQLDKSDKV